MKQILSIAMIALLMSACQSNSASNENSNTPVSDVEAVTGSEESAPTSAMPALNPAHGMPFHDCSIAVGAPLVAKEPVANPVELKKQVVLNPEHGMPGHRCDIAVGAPLN